MTSWPPGASGHFKKKNSYNKKVSGNLLFCYLIIRLVHFSSVVVSHCNDKTIQIFKFFMYYTVLKEKLNDEQITYQSIWYYTFKKV